MLGGSAYVALGIFGGMLIGFKKLVPDRHDGFRTLSIFAAISLSTSWALLYWLATTPNHVRDMTSSSPFSWSSSRLVSVSFTWYHFVFIALGNIVFSGGAVVILCARLSMGPRDWMLMTFLIVASSITAAVF